jgi:hypothetical protein
VGGRVVMVKESVVVAPNFRSFTCHILSQGSQNVTVKVRVNRSVRRNRFTVHDALTSKKKTTSILSAEEKSICWIILKSAMEI